MIASLRRKFILIAMASLSGAMLLLWAAIGIGNRLVTTGRLDDTIGQLQQNGGRFLPPGAPGDPADFRFQVTPETPFETRYFVVELTAQDEILAADLAHIAALDRQTVADTVASILKTGRARGYLGHYRFGVFAAPQGGRTVIVLDGFLQLQAADNMLRITAGMFLACWALVLALLLFFSKRVVRPFADNLERQRRFVTDASHELKTPLAILSADLGLLEDNYGGDQWLQSARSQAARLDKLIKKLVELARTEETVSQEAAGPLDFSELGHASVEAFLPLAAAAGKTLVADIPDGLVGKGSPDQLLRLFSILLDNAVKYCDAAGTIRLQLSRRGRHVVLAVSNPCAGLDAAQIPRFFDRFYRAEASRDRATGGYGIGLSTAKAIVARCRGRITVRWREGTITFVATLPAQV